jgi:hypothetical protein
VKRYAPQTYVLTDEGVGHTMRVCVIASTDWFSSSEVRSAETDVVGG